MNYDLAISEAASFQVEFSHETSERAAFHQAGHALAICLRNKQEHMPAVYFQIMLDSLKTEANSAPAVKPKKQCRSSIEGGRLIQNLPYSFDEAAGSYSCSQREEYYRAFEADIINLLAGPLAEAKFVANRDDEVFNSYLINLGSLHFYGGAADLELISDYMACLISAESERSQKLSELYEAAFRFVENEYNWALISALAGFIIENPKTVISCEEIGSFIESWRLTYRPVLNTL